jgi:hypothetical protein
MRFRMHPILGVALALTIGAPAFAADFAPTATERAITRPDSSFHADPAAAFGPGGVSALVWEDSRTGIQGQVFDAEGGALGPVLALAPNRVPSIPGEGAAELNSEPTVAFLPNGDLLVAWASARGTLRVSAFHQDFDVTERRVMVRRFRTNGRAAGLAFAISGETDRLESWPRLHPLRGGRILAAWRSDDAIGDEGGLFVRHLTGRGRPLGDSMELSAPGDHEAQYLSIAENADGSVLFAWEGCCDAGGDLGIYVRSYPAVGKAFGPIRQVNGVTDQKQRRPSVVADGENGFLVVWQGIIDRRTGHVFGRFADVDGAPAGGQFQVSHGHGPVQVAPAVAAAPDGGFLAVWRDWVGVAFGVSAQRLDAAGQPIGEPVRLNSGKTQKNGRTSLAGDGSGRYLIPWEAGFEGRPAIVAGHVQVD